MVSIELGIWARPGAPEKGVCKELARSYPEPTQVLLGEKPKACRETSREGIRQIRSVTWG